MATRNNLKSANYLKQGALIVAVVALSLGIGFKIGDSSSPAGQVNRQEAVKQMGARVMPFDLSKTLHTFTKTSTGGTQSVTVRDPADLANRDLARGHLRSEVDKFSKGDFADPSATHGKDLPGVATIRSNSEKISFTYEDLPDGARIVYTTDDPKLVAALSEWFDAQVSDHGSDAQHGGDNHGR